MPAHLSCCKLLLPNTLGPIETEWRRRYLILTTGSWLMSENLIKDSWVSLFLITRPEHLFLQFCLYKYHIEVLFFGQCVECRKNVNQWISFTFWGMNRSLEMLVGVNLAEEGILRLLFAAVYLMLCKSSIDNEVSAASR